MVREESAEYLTLENWSIVFRHYNPVKNMSTVVGEDQLPVSV